MLTKGKQFQSSLFGGFFNTVFELCKKGGISGKGKWIYHIGVYMKFPVNHSGRVKVMVFYATFNNMSVISWRSVLLLEETGENQPTCPKSFKWLQLNTNVMTSPTNFLFVGNFDLKSWPQMYQYSFTKWRTSYQQNSKIFNFLHWAYNNMCITFITGQDND